MKEDTDSKAYRNGVFACLQKHSFLFLWVGGDPPARALVCRRHSGAPGWGATAPYTQSAPEQNEVVPLPPPPPCCSPLIICRVWWAGSWMRDSYFVGAFFGMSRWVLSICLQPLLDVEPKRSATLNLSSRCSRAGVCSFTLSKAAGASPPSISPPRCWRPSPGGAPIPASCRCQYVVGGFAPLCACACACACVCVCVCIRVVMLPIVGTVLFTKLRVKG